MKKTELNKYYLIAENGCWNFQRYINDRGYGQLKVGSKTFKAHRYFYEVLVGKIPTDLTIDHLCRNRSCVNPKHLEVVTFGENVLRGNSGPGINRRKKRCVRGHIFSKLNTRVRKRDDGKVWRQCHACQYIHNHNRKSSTIKGEGVDNLKERG